MRTDGLCSHHISNQSPAHVWQNTDYGPWMTKCFFVKSERLYQYRTERPQRPAPSLFCFSVLQKSTDSSNFYISTLFACLCWGKNMPLQQFSTVVTMTTAPTLKRNRSADYWWCQYSATFSRCLSSFPAAAWVKVLCLLLADRWLGSPVKPPHLNLICHRKSLVWFLSKLTEIKPNMVTVSYVWIQ